jgi:hypothetical protein
VVQPEKAKRDTTRRTDSDTAAAAFASVFHTGCLSRLPEPLEKYWRLAVEVWPFLPGYEQQQ